MDAAIDHVEDEHRPPLLALGRVDRRQHQPVLVSVAARRVAGRARRIEREVLEEAGAIAVAPPSD
jgi:hypothetical protein